MGNKKIFAFLAIIMVLLSACDGSSKELGVQGSAYTVEGFAQQFNTDEKVEDKKFSVHEVTMVIEEVAVQDETIVFSAQIIQDKESKTLSAVGKLFHSFKMQNGINSIVGELQDSSGNFDVLHFEIYNSDGMDFFYATEAFRAKPHLKVYLQEIETKKILLFELDIPEELQDIVVTREDHADSSADGAWMLPFVTFTVTATS